MTRKVRELIDGGIYHVYNRGNGSMEIFRTEANYLFFLKKLRIIKIELGIDIYHYCIMPNHFHLLLQVKRALDLSVFMHRAQLSYAKYFQNRSDFVGHVFQERFRSPRIAKDSYYLQCGRYIERNPVKAGLVKKATAYPFSSAAFYGCGKPDPLVTPNILYMGLGKNARERQDRYQKFLSVDEPYENLIENALRRA